MEPNTLAESRASKTTNAQFEIMLDFMKKHGDLSTKTSGPLVAKVNARHKWTELINSLNTAGPIKTLKQWFKVWADWKSKVKSKIRMHNSNLRYAGLKPLDEALGQFMNLKIAGVNADRDYKEPEQTVGDRRFRLSIHGFPQKPRARVLEVLRRNSKRKTANLETKHRVIAHIEKLKLAIDKKIDVRKRRSHDLKKKQVTTREDIHKIVEKRIDLEEKIVDIQGQYLDCRLKTLNSVNELFALCCKSIEKLKN